MRRIATAVVAAALATPIMPITGVSGPVVPGPGTAAPLALDGVGECRYPAKPIKGTPWSLQRVLLDQLWQDTKGKDGDGRPVRVAVIDTGVDIRNPQLKDAVDAKSGADLLTGAQTEAADGIGVREADNDRREVATKDRTEKAKPTPKPSDGPKATPAPTPTPKPSDSASASAKPSPKPSDKPTPKPEPEKPAAQPDPTLDLVGHGTKVAGIIAARPSASSGFVGLAPESVIIPIRQNDEKGTGTSRTLAQGINLAVAAGAQVINISQDTAKALKPDSDLELAVKDALAKDVVVVASAGNDGLDGTVKETYPAAYKGVLAVAASDRNNERAPFSQPGEFVGVAAPGVEMVSTVPLGGQCVDNGTSFSAPYVAGVAALIRAKHPDWKQHQVVAQIEQTAERVTNGHDRYIGWGVVDPVRALTDDAHPLDRVTPDKPMSRNVKAPAPARMAAGESPEQRQERLATYALGGAALLVAAIAGVAVVLRDLRRRRSL